MSPNQWLVAAVVILALALAAQSLYIFKSNRLDRKDEHHDLMALQAPVGKQSQAGTGFQGLGRWNDPFIDPGFDTWDPLEEMDRIQDMMNQMFRDSLSRGSLGKGFGQRSFFYEPDLDIQETKDEYILRLDLPGIEKDKVNIKIQDKVLTISGEREEADEEEEPGGSFYRMERRFGSFSRSFPLPADANPNGMTAETKHGVLTIRLPKVKDPD